MSATVQSAEQKSRVRRSAILVGLIALGFYLGCIALFIVRGSHH